MKSRRGRGGVVEDIRVTNIVMQGVLCPFTMNLYYACGAWGDQTVSDKQPHPVDEGTPHFRRIHLSHITAREAKYAAAFIYGLPEMPVEDVSLSDVSVSMAEQAQAGYPEMADDMELMQRAGVFVANARGLKLHNVEVTGQLGPAFMLNDSADVDMSGCTTRTPCLDAPVIRLKDVEDAFVHGCRAGAGTETFLQLEGAKTHGVVLSGNHLRAARRPLVLSDNVRVEAVETLGE